MATPAICAIGDCCNPVIARGWCDKHYRRFRKHGDPEARARCANGEVQAFVRDVVLPFTGDECLTWPFATLDDGYGVWEHDGRMSRAHRHVCRMVHGEPPSPEHHAAHSCGNGNRGCVTPNHLRWATPAENQMDRVADGTSNRGERCANATLTEDDVRSIRALAGTVSQSALAGRFGVTQPTISGIVSGRSWAWLDSGGART